MIRFILITFLAFSLLGCDGFGPKGGSGQVIKETTTTTSFPDGTESVKEERVSVKSTQVDNAKTEGTIKITTDAMGETSAAISTGVPRDSEETKYQYNLLKLPMYSGGILVTAGILLLIFSPNKIVGIGMTLGGGAVLAGVFLLAKYSLFFLIGGIIISGIVILFFLHKLITLYKSNQENISLIQLGKDQGIIDGQKLAKIAPSVQSKSTRRIVKQTKDKEFGRAKTKLIDRIRFL